MLGTVLMIVGGLMLVGFVWSVIPSAKKETQPRVTIESIPIPKPLNYVPSPVDAFVALGVVRDRYVACGASESEVKQLLSIAPVLMMKESDGGSD